MLTLLHCINVVLHALGEALLRLLLSLRPDSLHLVKNTALFELMLLFKKTLIRLTILAHFCLYARFYINKCGSKTPPSSHMLPSLVLVLVCYLRRLSAQNCLFQN